ncbi:lipopolysaccharide biosynthesis protein, partial [Micromonospora sp. STR1_7]|nr:lipopolysaccharide biosynthesis protein [Micromonospora parastrephiae]
VGAAAGVGVLAGGRGLPGLAVTLGVLVAGCVGLLTLPRVRAGIRVTMKQIRGRDDAATAAGPAPASTRGR